MRRNWKWFRKMRSYKRSPINFVKVSGEIIASTHWITISNSFNGLTGKSTFISNPTFIWLTRGYHQTWWFLAMKIWRISCWLSTRGYWRRSRQFHSLNIESSFKFFFFQWSENNFKIIFSSYGYALTGERYRKINRTWTESNLGSNSLLNFWFCWIWSFNSFAFISFARFLACCLSKSPVPKEHVTGFHAFCFSWTSSFAGTFWTFSVEDSRNTFFEGLISFSNVIIWK